MAKLTLLLLAVLVGCGLGLVSAQHQARTLYGEREQAQVQARDLDVEYGRLQLEAGTWSRPARIAQIAAEKLGMQVPEARRVRSVHLQRSRAE
ncbi:MAG TPA: cell division protein FtsL [Burkholderiales bacterium]|nr:cell division protein FtsL [Burkholderiales bacterium]